MSALRDDATAAAACLLTAAAFAAAAMATTDCCCNRYDAKFDDIEECGAVADVAEDNDAAEQCIPEEMGDAESNDAIDRNGKIMMFNPPTLQIKASCVKIPEIHYFENKG